MADELVPIRTPEFEQLLESKQFRHLKERIETACARLVANPTGACNSHRLKGDLHHIRAADVPQAGGRGKYRILFGLHGEHPEVKEGQIVFLTIVDYH